ncbi:MAG: AraC family transcriptional activator of pyochelin receptor [Glaciecola sp.]|jgi:AraC family transcriptional activator of pyochelin receptor
MSLKITNESITIDKDFIVMNLRNDSSQNQQFTKDIDSTYIQFHFCLKGNCKFNFNNGNYTFDVIDKHSILLYNVNQKLPMNMLMMPKTALVSLIISIEKFHSLFSSEASYIHFLSEENRNQKFYDNSAISPDVMLVLNQLINTTVNSALKEMYVKGKVYELLSLQFNREENIDNNSCPFQVDDEYVVKIRKAKDIVIERMTSPPTLSELSNEVGLNIKKLKEGFKQIYGDTVFSFLFDYKMESARRLLESGKLNVNEVGLEVGYSSASHFIAAFKKKFGTTPKKYVGSS